MIMKEMDPQANQIQNIDAVVFGTGYSWYMQC